MVTEDDIAQGVDASKKGLIPVMEIFGPTIQGEGALIGCKTLFLRLGGCDYRCCMCDSMFAVDPKQVHANAKWMSLSDIYSALIEHDVNTNGNTPWITISGGNPAIWDLQDLPLWLTVAGYKVAVETQGTIWNNWLLGCEQVTISPKGPGMGEKCDLTVLRTFLDNLGPRLHRGVSVKIVVFSAVDLEFATTINQMLNDLGFPSDQRYLSVGNSWPPGLEVPQVNYLPSALLEDYRNLLEQDYFTDKRLSHWKFLPQLHTLIWANKQGV